MPTRKQPQVLLWVVIFQTDEALTGLSVSKIAFLIKDTYPIHAHRRHPPNFLVFTKRAHTYHLKSRIINVLLRRRLWLSLPKQLRELLKRVEGVCTDDELVIRWVIS